MCKKSNMAIAFYLMFCSPFIAAEEAKVRLVAGRLILEAPGIWRDLGNGEQKHYVSISPNWNKVIYLSEYDPRKSPATTMTVLDAKSGKVIRKIPIEILSQFLEHVEWIDVARVAVSGFIDLVIIDIETGKLVHKLGKDAYGSISPDGKKIVLRTMGGSRGDPPEVDSDYIRFALVDKGLPPGKERDPSVVMTIYPEVRSWGEDFIKRYENLNERHRIVSPFVWSMDSRNIAFVEKHKAGYWLTIITIDTDADNVKVNHKRVQLQRLIEELDGPIPGRIVAIEWLSGGGIIKVATEKSIWSVDINLGRAEHSRRFERRND